MILIDPDAATAAKTLQSAKGAAALKVSDLRRFLLRAKSAIGLEGEISVLLASDATIRTLNRNFRKKDQATDVLSFPVEDFPGAAQKQSGDLAVSLETAQRQAEEHGHPLQMELKILMLHGLLHLAGYDHETDNGEMARRESALQRDLDLTAGLIQRSARPKRASAKMRGRRQ